SAGAGASNGADSAGDASARARKREELKIAPTEINPSRVWRIGFPLRNSHSAFRNRNGIIRFRVGSCQSYPFLPTNPRYGIEPNHGSNGFRYCFLLHRHHSARAKRATERIPVRISVTFALKCTFT